MPRCDFFTSEAWNVQCWETAKREWTLKDTTEAVNNLPGEGSQIDDDNRTEPGESNQKLGAVLENNSKEPPVDQEKVITAWQKHQDLPDACPHEPHTETRCIFHAQPSRKSPEDVSDAFYKAIQSDAHSRRTKQFVGARFSEISLQHGELDASDNFPIDLRHAKFYGRLDLTDTVIEQPIYFDWAVLNHEAKFLRCEFKNTCTFKGTLFDSLSNFEWAEFGKKLDLDDAHFREAASFTAGTFNSDSDFLNVTFDDEVEFRWVDFHRYPNFEGTVFNKKSNFGGATFHDDAGFANTTFHGELLFRTDFGGFSEYEAHVTGVADFRNATFTAHAAFGAVFGGPTTFENATFHTSPNFSHATFEDRVQFNRATFTTKVDFSGAQFDAHLDFTEVGPVSDGELFINFTEAVLPSGSFVQPSIGITYYDFTGATLGDIHLSRPTQGESDDSIFNIAKFFRTEFDNFDFTDYKRDLSPDWNIHQTNTTKDMIYDPSELEATYLKAKNGAKDIGDSNASAEFFLKEMRYRRKKHWKNIITADENKSRIISAIKWTSNWLYNITCGYGERPLRTFGISLLTIAAFAVPYTLVGTGSDIIGGLELSFQSFVAFMNGPPPANIASNLGLLMSFEAFFGAFLIALFVFTLTRSLNH